LYNILVTEFISHHGIGVETGLVSVCHTDTGCLTCSSECVELFTPVVQHP